MQEVNNYGMQETKEQAKTRRQVVITSMTITKEDLYKAMGEAKEGEAVELLTLPPGAEIISVSNDMEIEDTGKFCIKYRSSDETPSTVSAIMK